MRFTIREAGRGSERVGCLTGFLKSPGTIIETPTSALLTQGGSVVHLTADVLGRVFKNPHVLWVPLSNSIHLQNGLKTLADIEKKEEFTSLITQRGTNLARFAALPDHITCMTLHNASDITPSGHFEVDKVPLWTKNGKKMITAERYMELMEVFNADIILAVADSYTSLTEGTKRISRSVERTCYMLDICMQQYNANKKLQESSLIGVIVGAAQDKKCDEMIQNILKYKHDLNGIALSGLTDGSEESLKVSTEQLEKIFIQINQALPKDLFRIIEGCWNPAVVVAAIDHGWDMFDGSYPLKLTNSGHALVLNFDINRSSEEICILNLNDVQYKDDFKPILNGCECLACKKHTRAYIRHLLNTREMLANVLLSIHNLHHFDQLFVHARQHITAQTFSSFKHHITEQYELYKTETISNTVIQIDKEISVDIDGNHGVCSERSENTSQRKKKKLRVSNDTVQNSVANGSVV